MLKLLKSIIKFMKVLILGYAFVINFKAFDVFNSFFLNYIERWYEFPSYKLLTKHQKEKKKAKERISTEI